MMENEPNTKIMPDEKRFILLEERLAFSERLNETLNEVVCDLQNRLTRLESRAAVLARELEHLRNQNREAFPRTPEDEKPPHY